MVVGEDIAAARRHWRNLFELILHWLERGRLVEVDLLAWRWSNRLIHGLEGESALLSWLLKHVVTRLLKHVRALLPEWLRLIVACILHGEQVRRLRIERTCGLAG